ncbi:Hypothetical protein PHPALM_37155 [Phytophthora palmivora]|uniref:CCHC-type domain-containing protein n=1 Tax=Phytophthora palmivora TaxID=4796 RepID=A0A2P4WY66_9STRA|nr:Hypothetical protein PHPALM_37155 [Phytophthora palmivora]
MSSNGKIELRSKGFPVNWNGDNWEYYKALMVSCFEEKDLEKIATEELNCDEHADEKERLEWKQKQAQIKRMVLVSVSTALAQRVMKKKTGTDMWKTLLEYYEAPSNQVLAVHKQRQLLHKLWHTRAAKVHDVDMVDAMLNSLPKYDKYQQLAQMVRFGIGGKSKPEEIRDLILVAEAQLRVEAGNIFGARGTSAVEYSKSTNKEQHADSTKKWNKKKHGRPKVECYNCHKFGHIRRFCPELESKPVAVAAVQAEETRKQTRKQQKQSGQHQFKTGNYIGIGVTELVTKDRNGQLKKFTLDRDPTTGTYNVYEDGILLLTAALQPNNVWSFRSYNSFTDDGGSGKFTSNAEIVNFTKMDGVADIRTWHARLGHTNAQYLKSMVEKSLVDGMVLKSRNLQLCETCQLAKQKRKKHMKSLERDIRNSNDVLFVDLMDPGKHNRTRFTQILVVVDGFSRLIRTYPLKDKKATNGKLLQYIAWAERQMERKVKCVCLMVE